MKSVCTLEIELPDAETARNMAKALELDNEGYLETRVEGNVLHVTATAESIMALRNTLDDYLACFSVALGSLDSTK